jgi:hypothetical protein
VLVSLGELRTQNEAFPLVSASEKIGGSTQAARKNEALPAR